MDSTNPQEVGGVLKILVVDDAADIRELVSYSLIQKGHEVTSAPSGNSAIEKVRGWSPQIVVTDLSMDDGDGLHLIADLRKRGEPVGIVVMSGSDEIRGQDVQLAVGRFEVARLLKKPFSYAQLMDAVLAATQQYQRQLSAKSEHSLTRGVTQI
jgi:CheY-like chemotaxis protein